MTIRQSLSLWTKIKKASQSPLLDAELLLAHVLKKPREFLYTYPEKKLTSAQYQNFKKLINKRAKYWPIAYLTGIKEFYGLDFIVNKDVLIPRPETEELVDLAKGKIIVDVGTGCGNIAIAIAKKLPQSKVIATDISKKALDVARENAKKNKVKVEFYQGSMLEALPKKYYNKIDLIVSNPPYLPKNQANKKSLQHEPMVALTPPQGKKPNYWIDKLLKQAPKYLKPNGRIIYEGRDGQIFSL